MTLVTNHTSFFLRFLLVTRMTRTRNCGWLFFSAWSVQYQSSPLANPVSSTIFRLESCACEESRIRN